MRELVTMWRSTRMVVLTAICAALYAALLIPFKVIPIIPGVREGTADEMAAAGDRAAQAFADAIMQHPGEIYPLILGPLTNIARALELVPEITANVAEVVIMGGAVFCPGNITPVAEVNYYLDAPATHSVQYADWPIVLAPLDVCDFSFLPPATCCFP